jgi:hypothetical protein
MADFVCESEFRYFGRNTTVVVDECDDTSVEASLGLNLPPVNVLRVRLVLLTDSS